MITVQMTEAEYKAYQLYLKSVDLLKKADVKMAKKKVTAPKPSALKVYLSNSENKKDLDEGIADIKAGRLTIVDPYNLWDSIE